MIIFTIYSRSYCHLCDDMRDALQAIMQNTAHRIVMVDVDQSPELLNLYDELVPVLFACKSNDTAQAGQQLCHYFWDADKVKAFCDE